MTYIPTSPGSVFILEMAWEFVLISMANELSVAGLQMQTALFVLFTNLQSAGTKL